MPQLIEVPGHGVVEFPDGMSDAQIAAAIKKNSMTAPAKPKNFLDAMKMVGGLMVSGHGSTDPKLAMLKSAQDAFDKSAYQLGGAATDLAAGHVPPEVAGGIGLAANAGMQAAPAVLGGEIAKIASPVFKGAGRKLMQSALKPTVQDLLKGKATRAIDTMLEKGFNPTEGGVLKMRQEAAKIGQQIDALVATHPELKVDLQEIKPYIQQKLSEFLRQATPGGDVNAIKAAWKEFVNHPLINGQNEIPVGLAQQLKKGTYKAIGGKAYGEQGSTSTEAQKTIARGLKDQIAKNIPQVSGLNQSEGDLLNAANVAQRRAMMQSNLNPFGLAPLAKSPVGFAAMLADRWALLKALAARGLYSGSEQIPANVARGTIGALMVPQGKPPKR